MAGLGPAIHVLLVQDEEDVDARHKAGHDGRAIPSNPDTPYRDPSYSKISNPTCRSIM
jgi:hypothetical protein